MFASRGYFDSGLLGDISRIQRELEGLFEAGAWSPGLNISSMGSYPPINIGSSADRVDVYLFAAGLDPKTIDLSIQKNQLAISGERMLITEDGADYYRQERFDGKFRRVITLPEDVDPGHVDASYRDGVIHVSLARYETVKPHSIEVKS